MYRSDPERDSLFRRYEDHPDGYGGLHEAPHRRGSSSDRDSVDVDRVQRVRRRGRQERRRTVARLADDVGTAGADDKAEIEAAVAAYDRALVTVNREQEVTPQLSAVATDAWAEQLVTTYDDNLFSNGLTMVGRWRTKVESVTIDGDSAEADVCSDGNKVYVVEGGGSIPSGTQSQGRSRGSSRWSARTRAGRSTATHRGGQVLTRLLRHS